MNESNLPGLSSFGWDTLKIFIDHSLFEIPDNFILSQFLCNSIPDCYFITHILSQHSLLYETRLKVKNILDTSTAKTLWKDTTEAIYEDRNIDQTKRIIYDQLYVILSLLDYRKDHTSQSRLSNMQSISILKEFSNLAIKNIRYDLRHPLKSDLITRDFCKEKCINYKIFKHHELISKYFWNTISQPFGSLPNYTKDSKWNIHVRNIFKLALVDPEDNTLITSDKNISIHNEFRNASERRMSSLFPSYFTSKEYLKRFALAREENCPNFFAEWSHENDNNTSRQLSQQRHLKKAQMKEQILCHCQFCGDYRSLPRQANGKYAWHCKDNDCRDRYRTWINDLNSRDIELEKLYK